MDELVETISRFYPCREKLIRKLYQLYGSGDPFPPAVYMFGHTSTGKSVILEAFLACLPDTKHAILNANRCYTNKILFESILNLLEGHEPCAANGYSSAASADSMRDFVARLQRLDASENYLIVLENAERVRDMDHNVLPMLLRLPEVTGLNISVVLVSDLSFEKYYVKTGLPPVVKLFVPEYSKKDIFKILFNEFVNNPLVQEDSSMNITSIDDSIETKSHNFYENYLVIFLNVFFKACRDLQELQVISNECFVKYSEPVIDGTVGYEDVTKLWRNISKTMKLALSNIYMRTGNASQEPVVRPAATLLSLTEQPTTVVEPTEQMQTVKRLAQNLELPFYAKYLLIAAYLASHNPAKEDKRLFMKNHGKQRKRLQTVNAKAKVSEKMATQLGPKSFNIDRLLAIFYAILDEKVGLTCNLLAQISTLIHLKFLNFASGEGTVMDGSARLQCTVGMDFIMHIGKMVGFEVRRYLCDFF